MVLVSPTWAPFSLITRIVTLPGLLASLVTRGESGKMLLEEVMFTYHYNVKISTQFNEKIVDCET